MLIRSLIGYSPHCITYRLHDAAEIVLLANKRCNQEDLIAQLKSGVQAIRMAVDDQTSNWAYMVMASVCGRRRRNHRLGRFSKVCTAAASENKKSGP